MKFYKRDPDAALAGMAELTLQERGAYNTILDALYSRDGALLNDDEALRRLMGCHGNELRAVKARLIAKKKIWIDGDYIRARRVEEVLKEAENFSETQRKRAGNRWDMERKHTAKTENHVDKQGPADAIPRNASIAIAIATAKEESNLSEPSSDKRKPGVYPDDFNAFWKAYPTDSNMSKKLAHARWAKLSPEQRKAAMAAMPGFRRYCEKNKSWYRPVHAERFLSQERFEGYEPEQQMTPEEIEAQKDRTDRLLRRGKYDPQFGERRDGP